EGARRVDEWSLIQKKIPSFDLIFLADMDHLAIGEGLTDTQERLLPLLDGSRDVNQVIEDSGLAEFEVGKAVYGLITAGFLRRARTDGLVYLGWGIVALKRGDAASAAGRLDHAKELLGQTPPPTWFWARALTAACAREFELAEEIAGEGVAAYPEHAALQNNLAVLRELAGDLQGAETIVRGARKHEPSLPQLSKNLGDLAYRAARY